MGESRRSETVRRKRETALQNIDSIKELLVDCQSGKTTVAKFCRENNLNQIKISKLIALLSDITQLQEGVRMEQTHSFTYAREYMTATEKLYMDVMRCNVEETASYMPIDAEETVHDLLTNYSNWGLSEREAKVLKLRYYEDMTMEKVGRAFGVTKERIRQVEAKALRKLMHPTRRKKLEHGLLVTEASERMAKEASERLIEELTKERIERDERVKQAKQLLEDEGKLEEWKLSPMEELGLSTRAWTCLKRHGCKTIGDVTKLNYMELTKIRNLGRKSSNEIVSKVRKYMPEYLDGYQVE